MKKQHSKRGGAVLDQQNQLAAIKLGILAREVKKPVSIELTDENPNIGTYVFVVAVADDKAKIAQLEALVKSWK